MAAHLNIHMSLMRPSGPNSSTSRVSISKASLVSCKSMARHSTAWHIIACYRYFTALQGVYSILVLLPKHKYRTAHHGMLQVV